MFLLSQLNWPRILFTRCAVVLLGLAAALSVVALAVIHSDIEIDSLSPLKREALSITGAAGAFGLIGLIVCMGFFWLRCDSSSKPIRALWFVLLLFGFAYGSQIAYFAIVYLPAVMRRLRNPEGEEDTVPQPHTEEARKRIGPFRRVLVVGWAFLLLPVAAAVSLPKIMSPFVGPIAVFFFLWSALVAVESIAYAVVSLYQSGMSRPPSSGRRGSSRPDSRNE